MRAAITYVLVVVALWLAVVWNKRAIEQGFATFALGQADKALHRVGNPGYPKLAEVAARYGLDVSAMKNPVYARTTELADSDVFSKPPRYYDILIFGDSSLIWSFSPRLLEQITGKHVAFIGCESAYPNRGMVRLAERITKTYLKKDGLVVFLFAWRTWLEDPDAKQVVPGLAELVESTKTSPIRQPLALALDSNPRAAAAHRLQGSIEPRASPAAALKEKKDTYGRGCSFMSWGIGTNAFVLYCKQNGEFDAAKDAHVREVASAVVNDCTGYQPNPNTEANLRELAQSPMRHKVVAMPFSEWPLPALVCEARKHADQLTVLDLPKLAVDKYGITTLEFEQATHLANTGPVLASVVLGRELRDLLRR